LIGYFEGTDSERGIAWRAADSFALRDVLGVGLEDAPPDHSTISRTRRLTDLETHRAVFTWVLQCLSTAGLVKGKTIGIDATTLEANAALRSIVRRDSGESYEEFLTTLAKASGIGTPTRADLARIDRKRKKKDSNDDWTHPPLANLNAGPSRGSIRRRNATRSMPIGVASAATAGNDSFGNAGSCLSARVRISMRLVVSGARTCAGKRTCSSGGSCMPAPSILVSGCGRSSASARHAASRAVWRRSMPCSARCAALQARRSR